MLELCVVKLYDRSLTFNLGFQAELAMLMGEADDDKHFNLKDLIVENKGGKKKKKKLKKKREEEGLKEDDFQVSYAVLISLGNLMPIDFSLQQITQLLMCQASQYH